MREDRSSNETRRRYTNDEHNFVESNMHLNDHDLAEALNTSVDALRHLRRKLGLIRVEGRKFNDNEEFYIKTYFGVIPARKIAIALGRTEQAVCKKARRLGLSRSFGCGEVNNLSNVVIETSRSKITINGASTVHKLR